MNSLLGDLFIASDAALRRTIGLVILCLLATTLWGCDDVPHAPEDLEDDTQVPHVELPPLGELDPLPFATTSDYLTVHIDGQYRELFVKGINLGVAVPGTRAGELAATREQYARWFEQMRDAGINTLRIYTLHYPRFYEALAIHNHRNPDNPLYLLHGIWLDEQSISGDLFEMTAHFEEGILEVLDCSHGNCTIGHRYGRAYGEYRANVSPWILGWIIGREVHPEEVLITNDAHMNVRSFTGEVFQVRASEATEVWWARHLDSLIKYERDNYGVQRPVSVSSWPTLDPLSHPTEGDHYSDEDIAVFDISRIEPVDAPGGIFASYHAYPYYPDFIPDDPDYRRFEDAEGPNSYLGYLIDLRSHYRNIPLLIAEFGVPSSWGSAHYGHLGMDHGGHDEREQGEVGARMMRTIYDANCAGGAFFSWIDEWWKPTWITDQFDFPVERRALWHNVTAAEQNFGLIAFDAGAPDFARRVHITGDPALSRVRIDTDPAFFHARVELATPLGEGDRLVIGYDTYRADLGESILPGGVRTANRSEFALVIEATDSAELYVTQAYDLFAIWRRDVDPVQLFRSVPSDGGPWKLVRWQNGQERGSNDGTHWFEPTFHDIGRLRIRGHRQSPSSHDAVVVSDTHVDIRIPWSLLNFVDPSRRTVMHDYRDRPGRQLQESDGVALSIVLNGKLITETPRFTWQKWEQGPPTTERVKESLPIYGRALSALPDWID
ncbi:MAG: hypothetical protein H0U74_05220 [Bradymonadaceae bacterium]|nr:hypothetical protein [Lujinxingiaceae bacterium]